VEQSLRQRSRDARPNGVARRAVRSGEQIARSKWGDRAARLGLGARGVVFVLFGYLVGRVALGALTPTDESKPASIPGVAQALAAQSGGRAALFVLALGMVLYALFSLLDTVLHHNDETPWAKRWGDRLLSAWGVFMYAGLAVYSAHASFSTSGGRETSAQDTAQKRELSARVLRWPLGWLWLGVLGGLILLAAIFLVVRALRRSFRARLDAARMDERAWITANVLGTVGYLGRAGLFALVGGSIMSAAVAHDPAHGQGVNGALRAFARTPPGPAALWTLAVALVLYGAYLFIEMRYRYV
jgi:hypothetical protein